MKVFPHIFFNIKLNHEKTFSVIHKIKVYAYSTCHNEMKILNLKPNIKQQLEKGRTKEKIVFTLGSTDCEKAIVELNQFITTNECSFGWADKDIKLYALKSFYTDFGARFLVPSVEFIDKKRLRIFK